MTRRPSTRARIVQATIKNLISPKQGNRITWDTEIPGFGARITAGGAIAFVLDYRIRGRKRRYTIGRHPELTATAARDGALEKLRDIRAGRDPLAQREQERTEPIMLDLADDYLERHARTHKRPSSLRDDIRMLESIIRPKLGALRVRAVERRDVESLHASLRGTPYQANRVLALLSKMFTKAGEWGWRADNPVRGIPRFDEDRRETWLSVEQLGAFIHALDVYSNQNAADSLRLLLLTGSREAEVLKAEWPQFDLERGTWQKPSHHTKQKKIEHVPLNEPALELLRRMKAKNGTGPLFPGANGTARVTIRRAWVQVCRAAGLAERYTVEGKRRKLVRYRPILRIHDLRHTFASHLISQGESLPRVGQLLGHTRPETTWRYAHVADQAQRDTSNVFGEIFKSASKAKPRAGRKRK